MTRKKTKPIAMLLIFLLISLSTAQAFAKTNEEFALDEKTIFRALVQFIRVDKNWKIIEKDKDAGYIIFEYKFTSTKSRAAFEIWSEKKPEKEKDDPLNRKKCTVQLKIEEAGLAQEKVVMEDFKSKLKNEDR